MPRRPFKGTINVDVRDSVPDWEPYMPPPAPEGSPRRLGDYLEESRQLDNTIIR